MKFFAVLALCIVGASAAALTADEAKIVKDTWHAVHHNEIDILANFFQQHPEHQAKFPSFVGKDLGALKDTAKFATHATRIVSALSEVIELSGNDETAPALRTVLHSLGSDHKRRGIPKESFGDFRTSFVSFLKSHVTWNDATEHAWNDAFDHAFAILFESY